ncbi:nucleotidyltransferase family protein [uncultured Phascolarctobacterium sp.]|uniref:tRNA(Met) cytidine acetate ligase n=1 Tax=uncultured Phascolarctobacterium sp. TaxID=512296 RepID=UPI0025EADCD9|nr:nucleotidyltransferase family protein [uncultured Phascolarctobacterium sp.]
MQATGIIAEYNPFHNGHLYHIQETKRLTQQPVIVVMSGSFMQRGEPAVLSKWQRAYFAVRGGVDLVLELPCVFTLRSAEFFAKGAAALLAATGCVNALACGTENPQSDFEASARLACSAEAQAKLRELLQSGLSYAQAWEKILGEHTAFRSPNDILALEYTKALLQTAADIQPFYLQRTDKGYNSTAIGSSIASASAIRQALAAGDDSWRQAVPEYTHAALATGGYKAQLLWQLLKYRLRLLTPQHLAERCEASEGIENLLSRAADCNCLQTALAACSSKRYTASRIRRLLLQILLDQSKAVWQQQAPAYLRVLAFNDTGRQLLHRMKASAQLPIINKLGRNALYNGNASYRLQLSAEVTATDLWSMLQSDTAFDRSGNDFYQSPLYVRSKI